MDLAAYRRFISYIYAYRNGKKEKNTGFAKAEARGRSLKISIQMETAGNREGSLDAYGFLRKGEKLSGIFLGEMERSSGTQARLQYFLKVETDTEDLMESGYALDQLSGLWIKGGPGENYITIWDEEPVTRMELEIEIQEEKDTADTENIENTTEPELKEPEPETARQEAPESEKAEAEVFRPEAPESEKEEPEVFRPEAPESEKAEPEAFRQEVPSKQSVSEQSMQIESSAQMLTSDSEKPINGVRAQEAELLAGTEAEEKTEKEADERTEKEAVETITTEKETGEERSPERYVRLWNRLTPAFAHRNPFLEGEALDAILITPRELHFFCCKNWSAARNSFIYHGYYNYHHLLFGKAIDGNFFLAVPGTYSGKEQQMAVSFGFPVFKESKEKVLGSCRGYWCRVL